MLHCTSKKQIFRFPSILLLDLTIVTHTVTESSWESLNALRCNESISVELHDMLKFLLAAASYMRLSAYLFHDSQDDRISVAPAIIGGGKMHTSLKHDISQRRWFAPGGIFAAICKRLVILNHSLALQPAIDFSIPELHSVDSWTQVSTLFNSGRYREALASIKQMFGDNILDEPLSIIGKVPPGTRFAETLVVVAESLFQCAEYQAALVLYEYMNIHIFDSRV